MHLFSTLRYFILAQRTHVGGPAIAFEPVQYNKIHTSSQLCLLAEVRFTHVEK